jgi:MFS transporter, DHA1 family, tetracycline resistance protein
MGLASHGWMMALAVPPQMIASLKGPGLMSVLSDKVSPEQQGVLQGSVMSLRVLSKVCMCGYGGLCGRGERALFVIN